MRLLTALLFSLMGLGLTASPSSASELNTATERTCNYSDWPNCYFPADSEAKVEVAQHTHYQVRVGEQMCTVFAYMRYNHRHGFCSYAYGELDPRDVRYNDAPVLKGEVKLALTRPCASEDSPNCHFESTDGGHSFSSLRVGHMLCTVYDRASYNHTHGYCTRY